MKNINKVYLKSKHQSQLGPSLSKYCKMKKKMKYITVMPIFGLKNLDGEHHSIPCMQAYFIYRVFRKKSLAFSLATTGSRYLWYVQVFSKLLSGGFVCRAKWHHGTLPWCNMGKKYKLCSETENMNFVQKQITCSKIL